MQNLVREGKQYGTDHAGNRPGSQHVTMDRAQFFGAKNVAQLGWDDGEASAVARKQQA